MGHPLTLALLLCACAPTLPMRALDWTTAEAAAEVLGIDIEPGSVVWVHRSNVAQTTDRHGCRRTVEAPNEPIVLAHEIGHALGLDHVDDPANLMHPYVGRDTVELTHEQHEALSDELSSLQACP